MAEEYKPIVNQKKGYEPHGNDTSKRVGELQNHLNNFGETSVAGMNKNVKQEVRVKK